MNHTLTLSDEELGLLHEALYEAAGSGLLGRAHEEKMDALRARLPSTPAWQEPGQEPAQDRSALLGAGRGQVTFTPGWDDPE